MPRPRSFRELMKEYERRLLVAALEDASGNQTQAAELLQIPLRTLVYKLGKLGLTKPHAAPEDTATT